MFDVISGRRSIRRFKQKKIDRSILRSMVDCGRLAPSAANLQPVCFVVVDESDVCEEVFDTIGWAGYIKPSWTPVVDERPVAYILTLINNKKGNDWSVRDSCFAVENIVLYAESQKIGSCILLNFDKERVRTILNIPRDFELDTLVALGYKKEHPVVETDDADVKYYRDEKGVLHVPKKSLDSVLFFNKF